MRIVHACWPAIAAACFLSAASGALAHEGVTAPTPEGGIGWEVLTSTDAIAWHDPTTGTEHLRPAFSPEVAALRDKGVTVSGFMLPLDEGKPQQTHFLLFQSAPDCLFHMSMGPTHFIEVRTDTPIAVTERAIVLQGTMRLVDEQKGGIFYRINDGRLLSVL